MNTKAASILVCALLLSSCATQPPAALPSEPPGFWLGLMHGFLAFPSIIGSFFWEIRVYAYPNIGRWYDAGFMIGTAIFLGMINSGAEEKSYIMGFSAGAERARRKGKSSE